MPAPQQNLENHARRDPAFLTILLFLLLNLGVTIFTTLHEWPAGRFLHLWLVLFAIIFLLWALLTRSYATKVQDRVIRLEERLRLAALLPAEDQHHIPNLSVRQLVALRFASDTELPALVRKTIQENLDPKTIKQNIQLWRPDTHRV